MFFLLGRRFPYLTLIVGAAILIYGVARGSTIADVVGCLGLLVGGYRCISALRRRGVRGLIDGSDRRGLQ